MSEKPTVNVTGKGDKGTAQNSKLTAPGTPFPKGVSGNPGGRPKMSPEQRAAFTELSELGINSLRSILTNPEAKDADKIKASEVAFDRAWGKSVQAIDANINDVPRLIDTSKLTKEQRDALALVAVSEMRVEND